MIATTRRLASAVLALSAAFALSACAGGSEPVVTRLPSDGHASVPASPSATSAPTTSPRPSASETGDPSTPALPTPGGGQDCAGAPVVLAGESRTFAIAGDCPDVRIQGNGVNVDASGADIGTLRLEGGRIVVIGRAVGSLTISGNDDALTALSVGAVTLSGDRNTVATTSGGGEVRIQGNDNTVRVPNAGPIADEGARNQIG